MIEEAVISFIAGVIVGVIGFVVGYTMARSR